MSPLFSVLLPITRPPVLLPFAIESVLEQSIADFELLVICDGAPPETVACGGAYAKSDAREGALLPKGGPPRRGLSRTERFSTRRAATSRIFATTTCGFQTIWRKCSGCFRLPTSAICSMSL